MYNVHDGNEQCKNAKEQMRLLAEAFVILHFYRAKPVSESPKDFRCTAKSSGGSGSEGLSLHCEKQWEKQVRRTFAALRKAVGEAGPKDFRCTAY